MKLENQNRQSLFTSVIIQSLNFMSLRFSIWEKGIKVLMPVSCLYFKD